MAITFRRLVLGTARREKLGFIILSTIVGMFSFAFCELNLLISAIFARYMLTVNLPFESPK
jgi:hypothetical protein